MIPLRLRPHSGLLPLLIIYLILVMAYSYAIPFSKGPDEYINYQYIDFISRYHRLPVTISERQEAGVKADWQPLYHLIGGVVAGAVAPAETPPLKVTWEPPTRKLIDIVLPRATLVRTADERPPYRGAYTTWQIGRWVSMALGAGTLIATYWLSLTVWPKKQAIAVGATGFLVFMPRFLFTHAVLSDDTLLGFCLACSLLLLARFIKKAANSNIQPSQIWGVRHASRHRPNVVASDAKRASSSKIGSTDISSFPKIWDIWPIIGMGLMVGLAIVTKYTAIPAVGGVLLTFVLIARRQTRFWSYILRSSLLFTIALVLAVSWWVGWMWWHFNQIESQGVLLGLIKPLLPGAVSDDNPTTTRLTALFTGRSVVDLGEAPGAGGNFFDWAQHTFVTFWGVTVFGAEPAWPYPYWLILSGVALFCLIAVIGLGPVYRRSAGSDRIMWHTFGLYFLLFFPLPLLRFALSGRLNDAAQGRHLLFPAGPAIVLLLMAGWLRWFPPVWRHRAALLSGGAMLIWGGGHLVYLGGAYPPPLPVRTTPGPQVEVKQPRQIKFGDVLQLNGYQLGQTSTGALLQVDLLWQSLKQAGEDYRTELTLIDAQKQSRLDWISQPAAGRFPVRAWQPGDLVRDTLHLPLVGLSAGSYTLQLRLLGEAGPLLSADGEMVSLGKITLENIPSPPSITLWQQAKPYPSSFSALHFLGIGTTPVYRYRSTIPLTAPQSEDIILVGPDGQPHPAITISDYLRTFMVDYNWPSGLYQVQVAGQMSGRELWVENFDIRPDGWTFSPPEMNQTLQANFANKIELLGYDLPLRQVEAGGGIPLVLYWRSLAQMKEDYTIFVQLLDAELQRRGGYDRFPRENYNTYLWVPGEIVADGFAVPVDGNAPDGVYTIRVGWYIQEGPSITSLPLVQNGRTLSETSVVIGPLKVGGPPPGIVAETVAPEHTLAVDVGESISLRGYDLSFTQTTLQLNLYWQSLNQTGGNFTTFVHLRNQAGEIVAQVDQPPAAGVYPTSLWQPGESISDEVIMPLPNNLPSGRYSVTVGLYDFATGLRLPITGSADNSVELTVVEIE